MADIETPVLETPVEEVVDPGAGSEAEATDTAESGAPTEGANDGDKSKPQRGVQEKIGKLTRLKREAEERAQRAEWELERLRKEKETPAAPEFDPSRPVLDNFATHEEYTEAVIDWRFQQRDRALEAERQKAEAQKQAAAFEKRLVEQKAQIPDFDEVIGEAESAGVTIPNSLAAALMSVYVANPAEILHHFAKTPEAREEFQSLDPIQMAVRVGKLDAEISARKSPKPQQQAKRAPAPPSRIGTSVPLSDEPPVTGTDAEYSAWYRAQMQKV